MDLLTNLFTLLDMKSSVAVLCLLAATMIFMITEAHDPSYKRATLVKRDILSGHEKKCPPCQRKDSHGVCKPIFGCR